MQSIHFEVAGHVQGVGFRWYVVEKAKGLKLAGWVRNRPDGKVELAAGGAPEALAKFEEAVRAGPRGARIDQIRHLSEVDWKSLPSPFEIAR